VREGLGQGEAAELCRSSLINIVSQIDKVESLMLALVNIAQSSGTHSVMVGFLLDA
jgi:hypothetical protein